MKNSISCKGILILNVCGEIHVIQNICFATNYIGVKYTKVADKILVYLFEEGKNKEEKVQLAINL